MCLVAFAHRPGTRLPWVLASNRDEFHDRPAAPLGWWADAPLLGGRDLEAGGSWLALSREGLLALVTNVREPARAAADVRSRGELVTRWLAAPQFEPAALQAWADEPRLGFNLLGLDLLADRAVHLGNRPHGAQAVPPGLHGLSNATLGTPWPKVRALRQRLAETLAQAHEPAAVTQHLLHALEDASPVPDAELPSTGVPLERERQLAPAFIRIMGGARDYGTRCSTVVVVEALADGERCVHVTERRHAPDQGETCIRFTLRPRQASPAAMAATIATKAAQA